jgi:uncharacterized protein YjiS (DUF1127 family)
MAQERTAVTNGRMEDHIMVARLFPQLTGPRAVRSAASGAEVATAQILDTLLLWQARGRQRRALARLDDHLLRDIGCSRDQAARECAMPVWRA